MDVMVESWKSNYFFIALTAFFFHGFVFFLFFIVYDLITLGTASKELCSSFSCGKFKNISYPFSNSSTFGCGLNVIECVDNTPWIQFREKGKSYEVLAIFDQNKTIVIREKFLGLLALGVCRDVFYNFSVEPMLSSLSFEVISPYITIFECNDSSVNLPYYKYSNCNRTSSLFYYDDSRPNDRLAPETPEIVQKCNMFRFPAMNNLSLFKEPNNSSDRQFLSLLEAGFSLRWNFPAECNKCESRGVQCLRDLDSKFICASYSDNKAKFRRRLAIAICANSSFIIKVISLEYGYGILTVVYKGLGVGGTSMILVTFLLLFVYCRHRTQRSSSTLLTQNISSCPSSKKDLLKTQSTYFGAHVFSYIELEAATNNFDASKELGDGGYGTVYHGKLFDGREVAVKRLYDNNYRRVEQFMNEIEIITHLQHKNLVTLYGCTSRHSRELLLVYEYISNGTVADHLHGDRTKLSWPIRMNIAIETASALSYLHASDIIHRDIKSSNILLDENFTVKVADFGLSRSFPSNVSHLSTAPQGSPGYVDPTYYQCYQLTEKSDVYSFGVLLIELISSKPAIDINRHQNEIILANWAINKIQRGEVHELADPYLGVESDDGVKKMVTLVAELAFRCLQPEKEVRPSMEEVVEALYGIENEEYKVEKSEEVEIPKDNTAIA